MMGLRAPIMVRHALRSCCALHHRTRRDALDIFENLCVAHPGFSVNDSYLSRNKSGRYLLVMRVLDKVHLVQIWISQHQLRRFKSTNTTLLLVATTKQVVFVLSRFSVLWTAESYGDLISRSSCISLSGRTLMFAQFSLSS